MSKTQSEAVRTSTAESRTSAVVYCGCGREFETIAAHNKHFKLQGAQNAHNHQPLQTPPKPFDPTSKMFTVWAWDRLTTNDGSTMLIHAGHYIYIDQVISQQREPNPILKDRGTYYRQYLIEYFFPIISRQYPELLRTTDQKAAQILIADWDQELDEYQVAVVVSEYRRRHVEA